MLYLLGGFAILCGVLLLGYLFVNADPVRLARGAKRAGITVAVLAILALLVLTDSSLAALADAIVARAMAQGVPTFGGAVVVQAGALFGYSRDLKEAYQSVALKPSRRSGTR